MSLPRSVISAARRGAAVPLAGLFLPCDLQLKNRTIWVGYHEGGVAAFIERGQRVYAFGASEIEAIQTLRDLQADFRRP